MQILDWLRDGLLGDGARMKRAPQARRVKPGQEEREDPSGRHDFGRRAHHPDPSGRYAFEPEGHHRARR